MPKYLLAFIFSALLTGCASVKLESKDATVQAKRFASPSAGNAGVYIYRDSNFGAALKKDLWIDGQCVGESAPKVFFYTEVIGGKEHTLATESEFSPNELTLFFEEGKNYFFRQFIKLGVFVGGAGLEVVPEATGKAAVSNLELAASGKCGK